MVNKSLANLGMVINGQEGINVILYHKQMELFYDFCQFHPAELWHKNTCRVAAGGHEVNAFYFCILANG